MKTIYADRFVTVSHNADYSYALLKWVDFNIGFNDIVTMHENVLRYAVKNSIKYYIADTEEVSSILKADIIGWWRSKWVPELEANGIKCIFSITAQDSLARISDAEWKLGEYKTLRIIDVESITKAEQLISKDARNKPRR